MNSSKDYHCATCYCNLGCTCACNLLPWICTDRAPTWCTYRKVDIHALVPHCLANLPPMPTPAEITCLLGVLHQGPHSNVIREIAQLHMQIDQELRVECLFLPLGEVVEGCFDSPSYSDKDVHQSLIFKLSQKCNKEAGEPYLDIPASTSKLVMHHPWNCRRSNPCLRDKRPPRQADSSNAAACSLRARGKSPQYGIAQLSSARHGGCLKHT